MVRAMEVNVDAGERSIYWDSRDSNGHPVPSGMYYARVRVEGEAATVPVQILR